MSELAIKLINEAYEKKSTFLDLGNCGLKEIPKEILKLKDFLEVLNFSSYYSDFEASNNDLESNLLLVLKILYCC